MQKRDSFVLFSAKTLLDIGKMVMATLTISFVTSYWFAPVQGSTAPPYGTTEDMDEPGSGEEPDESKFKSINAIWPFVLSLFVACVIGAGYSFSRKAKKRHTTRASPVSVRQSSGSDHTSTTHREQRRSESTTNNAFDGDLEEPAPAYVNVNPLNPSELVEMAPPPYCDKPPDYEEICKEFDPPVES